MTPHPDEGTLHAYIDGELPPVEAEALEAHVAVCASCGAALAEARGLAAAASRAISDLDAAPSSARKSALPAAAATAPARRASRPPIFRVPYARAAALLLLVGGSAVVIDRSGTLDRGTASRAESPPPAAVAASEPASTIAASEAATMTAPASTPRPSTARDRLANAVGRAAGTAAGNNRSSPGVAGGVAADAATGERRAERTVTPPAPAAVTALQSAGLAAAQKQPAETSERARAPIVGAALPAPPPSPARQAEPRLEDVVAMSGAGAAAGVTRYRTTAGVILTLTEEPLRTSFAEESVATRTMVPPRVQQRAAAALSAPAVNSFRWSSAEKGATYTLAGPLTVAELEALSKRLSELERVP